MGMAGDGGAGGSLIPQGAGGSNGTPGTGPGGGGGGGGGGAWARGRFSGQGIPLIDRRDGGNGAAGAAGQVLVTVYFA